jgi:V8-like Glu-specific endopeptidase
MWTNFHTELQGLLSSLYPNTSEAVRIARESGLPIQYINTDGKPITIWHNILVEALRRDAVEKIILIVAQEYPNNPILQLAKKGQLRSVEAPSLNDEIDWRNLNSGSTLEKIIGKISTLLPISFLETGLKRSRSVVRILCSDKTVATGFVIKTNLLVTNHHVLPSATLAQSAIIQFNFQKTASGLDAEIDQMKLLPEKFFCTSEQDDLTVVMINGLISSKWEEIRIETIKLSAQERVFIIQHPGGGDKQIALGSNLVVYSDNDRVQYLTDTLPGSSGSPVFNDKWQVVAIHHSGGYITEPNTSQLYYRNEGIHISRLIDILKDTDFRLN